VCIQKVNFIELESTPPIYSLSNFICAIFICTCKLTSDIRRSVWLGSSRTVWKKGPFHFLVTFVGEIISLIYYYSILHSTTAVACNR
jgi:hypothetical protein